MLDKIQELIHNNKEIVILIEFLLFLNNLFTGNFLVAILCLWLTYLDISNLENNNNNKE